MTKKHWAARRNLTDFAKFLGNEIEESDIQYHLDSMAKNATYISSSSESADAFLDAINTHLKNKLSEELYLTTKFTLEADESTNASDNEALNIFLRYVCLYQMNLNIDIYAKFPWRLRGHQIFVIKF